MDGGPCGGDYLAWRWKLLFARHYWESLVSVVGSAQIPARGEVSGFGCGFLVSFGASALVIRGRGRR